MTDDDATREVEIHVDVTLRVRASHVRVDHDTEAALDAYLDTDDGKNALAAAAERMLGLRLTADANVGWLDEYHEVYIDSILHTRADPTNQQRLGET